MKEFFRFLQAVLHPLPNDCRDKGFILPLTLVFSFLLFSVLFHQISLYQSEKPLISGTETAFTLHRLTQMAAVDLENRLDTTVDAPVTGSFKYEHGRAVYEFVENDNGVIILGLTIVLDSGGEDFNYLYYDVNNKSIIRWEEGI